MKTTSNEMTPEVKEGLEILEKAVSRKSEAPKVPITETEAKPTHETAQVTETIKDDTKAVEAAQQTVETANVQTATNQTATATAPKKLSIWSNLGKKTQEDTFTSNDAPKDNIISNLASSANTQEADEYGDEVIKKESDKVRAAIVVEIIDLGFNLLCLLITWDFSDENRSRFKLQPDRKKAIEKSLFQLYQLNTKKTDPKKTIWFLILGSYAPMLIIAVMIFISKMQKRQQEAKRKKEINELNVDINETNYLKTQLDEQARINELLKAEIRAKNEEKIKHMQTETFSKSEKKDTFIPDFGKGEKKGRGVKAGTKRGSYNKNKKK